MCSYDWTYQSEKLINFWWLIRFQIRIPDHFSTFLVIAELGILGGLLAFLNNLLQSPVDFFLQNSAR